MRLLLSVFCMLVWANLCGMIVGTVAAVTVETCGGGHTATAAALIVCFSAAFSIVVYKWSHEE